MPIGPLFKWNLPWRHPDLRRFTRAAQFCELHSAAETWIEQQFARVQAEAAWLAPADRLVSDYGTISGRPCRSSWDIGGLLKWQEAGEPRHARWYRRPSPLGRGRGTLMPDPPRRSAHVLVR